MPPMPALDAQPRQSASAPLSPPIAAFCATGLMKAMLYILGPNGAVTVIADVSVTTHEPVPLHPPPDQPVNTEPEPAAAVSVTLVPWS